MNQRQCIIIGSGPAGYTAGIYCRRAGIDTLLLSGYLSGGQLTETSTIENFPGFPQGINGTELMDRMREQAVAFGLEIKDATVESVDFSSAEPVLHLDSKECVSCKTLIIATGARPRHLGIPGEDKFAGRGVSYCATCDGFFFRNRTVAVVGGGDTAAEEALYLSSLAAKVYMIVRKPYLRASEIMRKRVEEKQNLEALFSTTVAEVCGENKVDYLRINTPEGEKELKVDGLFPAIGHDPASGLFSPAIKTNESGYIITGPGSTATNIPNVFAAGDVADPRYRQAVTAAATGCMAAMDVEHYLMS